MEQTKDKKKHGKNANYWQSTIKTTKYIGNERLLHYHNKSQPTEYNQNKNILHLQKKTTVKKYSY